MTITVVELSTYNIERLSQAPMFTKVGKARVGQITLSNLQESLNLTTQKLKPIEPLWTEELKQLKINEKMLEKYPTVDEYLVSILDASSILPRQIFVPASKETEEILLQLQKQSYSVFYNQPVVALSNIVLNMITGQMFDQSTSFAQMFHCLNEPKLFESDTTNLLDDCIVNDYQELLEPSFRQEQQDIPFELDIPFNLEKTFELLQILLNKYKLQFIEIVQQMTDIQLNLFEQVPMSNQFDVLRIDSQHMLSLKTLEQLGFSQKDFFDVRHTYPSSTFIKFYARQNIGDKVGLALEGFVKKQQMSQAGQTIGLTIKPQVIDKFPPNPTFVYIKNIPKAQQTYEFSMQCINASAKYLQGQQQSAIKKTLDQNYYWFKQVHFRQDLEGGCEKFLIQHQPKADFTFLYPQMDHEKSKQTQVHLMELLALFEWGFVSQTQVQTMAEYKQQLTLNLQKEHQEPTVSRDQLTFQSPLMSTKQEEPRATSALAVKTSSAKFIRSSLCCVLIKNLTDARIKDIAGFCKINHVAELMAWQMHQPFTQNAGPIRMVSNQQAILIFNDLQQAQKALTILQNCSFKNQRITAEILDKLLEPEQFYLEQCFTLKEAPFMPCFCVIMKQISLPPSHEQFGELLANEWRQVGFVTQRVFQDNGIIFFRTVKEADKCYQDMRQQLFQGHMNDIFRIDFD